MKRRPKSAAETLLVAAALLILSAAGPGSLAEVTSLLVDSEPGEFIGRGEFNFYTPDDGSFLTGPPGPSSMPSPESEVRLFFLGFKVSWNLWFAAPPGEPLTAGVYEDAVQMFSRGPGQPGLNVSGYGRGCIGTSRRFEVKQVDFDAGGLPTSLLGDIRAALRGGPPAGGDPLRRRRACRTQRAVAAKHPRGPHSAIRGRGVRHAGPPGDPDGERAAAGSRLRRCR